MQTARMPFEASPQSPARHKKFGFGHQSSRGSDKPRVIGNITGGITTNRRKRKTSFRFKSAFENKVPSKMLFYSIQVAPQPPASRSVPADAGAPATSTTLKFSTVSSDSSLTRQLPKVKKQKKRVTFNEAANMKYSPVHTGVNPKELWFNKPEIREMRKRFKDYLSMLQAQHKHQTMASSKPSTIKILYRAYRTCTSPKARHVDVYPIQDANSVGAERLGVSNILRDIADRRHLLNIAAQTKTNPEKRAQLCRTISRPSRLYAIHVAKASILMENQS